ncbi:MAG: hypothetical protein JWN78_299 [Bacteroidota bacterium]|nr:hypothetical protein [Bacteroidota bacterium]
MNNFFVLKNSGGILVPAEFAGYVVFYKKDKDAAIAEIQRSLLEKMICNGLKLKLENFLFIDISEQPVRLSELKKTLTLKKCFLFGVKENEIGINFDATPYKILNVSNIEFLKVDAPEILEQKKDLKNRLWEQIQLSFKPAK